MIGRASLSLRLAASGQRGGVGRPRLGHLEQSADRYTEHPRQGFEGRHRDILLASLDPPDIGAVEPSCERKSFLGKPEPHAKLPDIPADEVAGFQSAMTKPCRRLTIDVLTIPYSTKSRMHGDVAGHPRAPVRERMQCVLRP